MTVIKSMTLESHVVDILGSTKGRDQPIMLVENALHLVELFEDFVFTDPDTVIVDPFCKAGEVLLAAALKSCFAHKSRPKPLASTDEIFHELYSGRYYALAPDERHYLLSLRTFYGNERSHDGTFTQHIRNGNYLSETDGRLDKDKFEKELSAMIDYIRKTKPDSSIVAIGNPPYQEADGGFGKSAKPIYNLFTETLIDCPDISQIVLVLPARWFGGGKGLDHFRERMIQSKHIRHLRYFKNAAEVFPTVDINGSVCFLHWDKSFRGQTDFSDGSDHYTGDLSRYDIIPDDPRSFSIIEKIQKRWTGRWVSDVAWASKPFGLRTFHFQKHEGVDQQSENAVPCLSNGRIVKYVSSSEITKNKDKINLWKVAVPKAAGGSKGNRRSTIPINLILLVPNGRVTTETYNIVHTFSSKAEAERMITYLKTNFARYLLGLRKITQDIPPDRWAWVPLIDTSREWTDPELFDFFKLSQTERQHIHKKVQEWS
ncbi:MAG: Eco57I restriction-modification methylase domain-containing protein [Nitrospirales bacterium]|nr:Eco57I restriction-modification methylase domain-containing protein [Nitrospirales bacterium]